MDLEVRENGNAAEIILGGHLDTRTAKDAAAQFALLGEKHDDITIDIARLEYISSAGIRVLRDLYMVIYQKSGRMRIINVPDNVMKVFEMTGLTGIMEIN